MSILKTITIPINEDPIDMRIVQLPLVTMILFLNLPTIKSISASIFSTHSLVPHLAFVLIQE